MRILWLSKTPGLYPFPGNASGYNGGGWISSLQELLRNNKEIELAVAFLTKEKLKELNDDNFHYYPIKAKKESNIKKLARYYGVVNSVNNDGYEKAVFDIVNKFKPDIIHIFGLENEMINILGMTNIPEIVHLQGLLGPYNNAFWPIDYNATSFLWPFSIREWIVKNGYRFEKRNMYERAKIEESLFSRLKYAMGRTNWDKQITSLLSPKCFYFHVDEVLRPEFYLHKGEWQPSGKTKVIITSTISDTMYKGFDVVLKTAHLLKRKTNIDFEWQIAGLNKTARIVKFFEGKLGYTSESVNIKFCGVLSEYQLCQQLLASSLYVHPSYIDNSPNSVCEAQLLGLPVIATNVGGISSLITSGEDGFLVPANAPYELAEYIKELSASTDMSKQISQHGYSRALQRHDKNKILVSLTNTYKAITKQRNGIVKHNI